MGTTRRAVLAAAILGLTYGAAGLVGRVSGGGTRVIPASATVSAPTTTTTTVATVVAGQVGTTDS